MQRTNVETEAGKYETNVKECIYCRRYAQRTVSCGMGNQRGQGSCKGSGYQSDGLYQYQLEKLRADGGKNPAVCLFLL